MANLAPIPSGTNPSQVTAMMNRNFNQLNAEQVTKLYNDANGTPSILIGVDDSGKSVIKVAKPGFNVTSASDSQLAFNSSQNTLKVVVTATSTIPAFQYGTGQINYTKLTIPHNLGYSPIVQAYVAGKILDFSTTSLIASGRIPLPIFANSTNGYWFDTSLSSSVQLNIIFGIDSTNLYIQASSSVTSGTAGTVFAIPLTYYLLQESVD